jgi:hypothetical protein
MSPSRVADRISVMRYVSSSGCSNGTGGLLQQLTGRAAPLLAYYYLPAYNAGWCLVGRMQHLASQSVCEALAVIDSLPQCCSLLQLREIVMRGWRNSRCHEKGL